MKKLTALFFAVLMMISTMPTSVRADDETVIVNVIPNRETISVGETLQLRVSVTVDGVEIQDPSIEWMSSNGNVSVDEYGLVTAISEGRGSVEAHYNYNGVDYSGECELEISVPLPEGSYTVITYYDNVETGSPEVYEFKTMPNLDLVEQKKVDSSDYLLKKVIVTAEVDGEMSELRVYGESDYDGIWPLGEDIYHMYVMTRYASQGENVTAHVYYEIHGADPYSIDLLNAVAYDEEGTAVVEALPEQEISVVFLAPAEIENASFFYWSVLTGVGVQDKKVDHFTFVMPSSPVTIRAAYKQSDNPTLTCTSQLYIDGNKTSEATTYFYEGYDGSRIAVEPIFSLSGSDTISLTDARICLSDGSESVYKTNDFRTKGHIEQMTFYDTWGYFNGDELPGEDIVIKWNYKRVAGLENMNEVLNQVETLEIEGQISNLKNVSFMPFCEATEHDPAVSQVIHDTAQSEIETENQIVYFDYNVMLTVASTGNAEEHGLVTELDNEITYIMYLDDDTVAQLEGKSVKVLMYHDGAAEIIDCTLEGNALSFETRQFSPYTIVAYTPSSTVESASLIEIFDHTDYDVSYDPKRNRYDWTIFISPIDFFSGSNVIKSFLFRNTSGDYDDISFEQIFEDPNWYAVPVSGYPDNDPVYTKLDLKAGNTSYFWVSINGQEDQKQLHAFEVTFRDFEIQKYSFASQIRRSESRKLVYYNYEYVANYDESQNIFKNMTVYAAVLGEVDSFVDAIKNDEVTNEVTEDFENDYYVLSFKEGVSVTGKTYSIITNYQEEEYPMVTYTLEKDGVVETLKIVVQTGNEDGGSIEFGGRSYWIYRVYHADDSDGIYTLYLDKRGYVDPAIIEEYFAYRYKNLVVSMYTTDGNGGSLDYYDGLFTTVDKTQVFEAYDAGDTEITSSTTLSELTRIYDLGHSIYITAREFFLGTSESEARSYVQNLNRVPTEYYTDENGTIKKFTKVFFDQEAFESYDAQEEPGLLYGLTFFEDPGLWHFSKRIKTNQVISVINSTTFGIHKDVNQISADHKNKTVTFGVEAGEQNVSKKFEDAIIDLSENYENSVLKLTSDLTLDADVLVSIFPLQGSNNSNVIDLNGHSIFAGAHKLDVPENCVTRFINNSVDPSTIEGNGQTVIKVYGRFAIENITICNSNGTGITVTNDFDGLDLFNDASIIAKTGIKWIERESGTYSNRFSNRVSVYGKIQATDYCIYAELPHHLNNIRNEIYVGSMDAKFTDTELTSDDTAVYVNGSSVIYHMRYATLSAKKAFVVNGGTYNLFENHITAVSDNANDGGDIFYVDSQNAGGNTTQISVLLEGEDGVFDYKASRSLVYDNANDVSASTASVSLRSSSGKEVIYFTYADDQLFRNVNSSNITINGGYYSDDDVGAYIDTNLMSLSSFVRDDGKTFFKVNKPDPIMTVYDFSQLRSALISEDISRIILGNNIDANNDYIDFMVDTSKEIDLNRKILSNIYLNASVTQLNESGSDITTGHLKIYNGSISNQSGPVLFLDGVKLDVFNGTSISTVGDHAIRLHNGNIRIEGDSYIQGNSAIYVDIDPGRPGFFGRLEIYDSEIVGKNGPAITFAHTFDGLKGDNFYCKLINAGIFVEDEQGKEIEADAIEVKADVNIEITDSYVNTLGYGIHFLDEYSTWKTSSIRIKGSTEIHAKTGIHLNKYSEVFVNNGTIDTTENVMEAYNVSGVAIYDGKFKGGNAIISYLDFPDNPRRYGIKGGLFSKQLDERSISDEGGNQYWYVCELLNDLTDPYPYAVMIRRSQHVNALQNISLSINRAIEIDQSLLETAIMESEREYLGESATKPINVILTIDEVDGDSIPEGFPESSNYREYYDIHINKNYEDHVEIVDEVTGYQLIKILLTNGDNKNYLDPQKVNVYHEHKGVVSAMKKVNRSDLLVDGELNLTEECFFISGENGTYYINLVTKRFSTFALEDETEDISEKNLKQQIDLNVAMSGVYADTYTSDEFVLPEDVFVGGEQLNVANDIKIIYEGTGNTVYYSESEFPKENGTYRAIWTVKEDNQLVSGSGSKEFTLALPDSIVLYGATLTLEDRVGIDFHFDIPDYSQGELDGIEVAITHRNVPYYFDITEPRKLDQEGREMFTLFVPVKELCDDLTVQVLRNREEIVPVKLGSQSGELMPESGYHYSGLTYIENMRPKADQYPDLVPFLDALYNFSKASRIAFNYEKEGISVDQSEELNNVTADSLSGYDMLISGSIPEGLIHYGASLTLKSETSVNHYFKLDDGYDISSYRFEISSYNTNGYQEVAVENIRFNGTYYIIDIGNLKASKLDRPCLIRVTNMADTDPADPYVVSYNPISYAYRKLADVNTDSAICDLVKTMYLYNAKAKIYFEQ